jgi:hypothetical protein
MVTCGMLQTTLQSRGYNRVCSVFLCLDACLSLHRSPGAVFPNQPHVTTHWRSTLFNWSPEFFIINPLKYFHIHAQYTGIFCGTRYNTQHVCSGKVSNSYSKDYWFESWPITTHPDRVLIYLPQYLRSNFGVASRLRPESFIPYSFDFTNNSATPFYSPGHSQSAP